MEDPGQADQRGKDAGQEAAPQAAVVIGEAKAGGGEPAEGLGQQKKSAGVWGSGPEASRGGQLEDRTGREGFWRGRGEAWGRVRTVRRRWVSASRGRRSVPCGAVEAVGVEEGVQR